MCSWLLTLCCENIVFVEEQNKSALLRTSVTTMNHPFPQRQRLDHPVLVAIFKALQIKLTHVHDKDDGCESIKMNPLLAFTSHTSHIEYFDVIGAD